MRKKISKIINEEINKHVLKEYSNPDLGSKLLGLINALDETYNEIYNDAKMRKSQGDRVSENEFVIQELGRCLVPLKKIANRII